MIINGIKFQKNARILTDERIGKLVVMEPLYRDYRRGVFWRCECECGNMEYMATSCDLLSGRITSCGCYRNSQEFADSKVIHGGRRQNKGTTSRTYLAWAGMKQRCNNPNASHWDYYGGRGITYDPRWEDYRNFLEDMGECPEDLEIDRIDNDKGYFKENCRWATDYQQAQNRRDLRSTNTSGVRGVHYSGGRWFAEGCYNGDKRSLYNGSSFELACLARWEWELTTMWHARTGEWL